MKNLQRNIALLLLAALAAAPAGAATVLRGATLHPVSGPAVPDGVMVIDGGKIVALGADVEIPAGSEVIDLAGKHVYPGFIQATSHLGLTEIGAVRATNDVSEMGEVNSDLRAEVAVNADSLLLPVAAAGGVLAAHVMLSGGTFTGTSAVIALEGWNWEDMTIASPVGMILDYPATVAGGDEAEEAKAKALETINKTMEEARAYHKARQAGAEVDHDAKLEGLIPVLTGELPLYVIANERNQIVSALDWAKEKELGNLVLITAPDAQYVAARLAEEKIPVILDMVHTLPSRRWEPYDMPFVAAKKLHEAGVRFCIGNDTEAANARNLPFEAATAAAFGLPKDVALRSITLSVAEILGVDDRLGSLDPGKDASFLVTDGDPLEILTRIEQVWIRGEEIDLSQDPQRRLYEKYNNRPRPDAAPR